MQTFVFKVADGCQLKVDLYRGVGPLPRPVLVWIHGGALMTGGRSSAAGMYADLYTEAGFTVASFDYRLAPEAKLDAIISDLRDSFAWLRGPGAELAGISPERMVVTGHSAGGYLTLMAGFCVEPRPLALAPFYGYGDIDGPWLAEPDPYYLSTQSLVPDAEALAAVGGPVLCDDLGGNSRPRYYLYCRQQGLWADAVTGFDPRTQPREFERFCPVRNVTAAYPPTLLLHGDADTDVPYQQSVDMARRLEEAGVDAELYSVPGGPHCFDMADTPEALAARQHALEFLLRHV